MKRIVFMMAVLLIGGLFAGSAFAQDANAMTLSPGGVDDMSLMPDYECLSEIDFKDLGLSPDVFYPMLTSALYGFDVSGGGGLQEGAGHSPRFCTPNYGLEPCGSCWRGKYPPKRGKIFYSELWCVGIRVWRKERCIAC